MGNPPQGGADLSALNNKTSKLGSDGKMSDPSMITPFDTLALDLLIESMEEAATRVGATPIDYSGVKADSFSDANGFKNTVDVANTTGQYNSQDKYYLSASSGTAEAGTSTADVARPTGYMFAVSLSLTAGQIINKIGLNVTTASGNLRVAIYNDSAGNPGTLLKESASTPMVNGWNDLIIPSYTIPTTATYWLAFQYDTVFTIRGTTTQLSKYVSRAYGAFPSSFGSPTTYDTYHMRVSFATAGIIQTNLLITAASNINAVQVERKSPAGSTITYDASSNNGVAYTTGLPTGSKQSITSAQGTQLMLRLNLDAGEDISGYSVVWWTA